MQITSTTGFLSVASPAGTATQLPSWQTGQQLTAVVLAQSGPQSVSLRIGDQTVEAHTTIALPPRTQLQLEVMQGGAQPILRITTAPPVDDTLATALRTALPQQAPLQTVFTALHAFAQNPAALANLPTPALALLRQVFAQLPASGEALEGSALQRALRDSGALLERKLAGGTPLGNDLKANLLRLLSALDRNSDDTVTRLVSAAVARIELHQLIALAQPLPEQGLTMELPLRRDDGVDVLQLRVEREAAAGNEGRRDWTIWMDFDIAPLGPVRAKVSWRDERVSAQLWAERTEGAALIKTHLDELEASLAAAGVHVHQLQCHHGAPPHDPFAKLPSRLVDVTA